MAAGGSPVLPTGLLSLHTATSLPASEGAVMVMGAGVGGAGGVTAITG